jgi:hypothetical protein
MLFTFFNSDLADQNVDNQGGASAYIDDYFRRRVGNPRRKPPEAPTGRHSKDHRTGTKNRIMLYREKTELIHLTRRKKELGKEQMVINGKTIQASKTAKLLGVVFDQEIRWKGHIQQAFKKATAATQGMSGLRHLRPAQMRQVYQLSLT